MQDALVDLKRPAGQAVARGGLDQAPAAERAVRAERGPVGIRQRRERKAEGGVCALRISLGGRAEAGEVAFEFAPGAEQEDVTFEARERERLHELSERRRLRRNGLCLHVLAGMPLKSAAQAVQVSNEVALVRLLPVRLAQIVTLGPKSTLVGSRSSGLSAPST
jgi:hypothetical protein